MYPTRLYDEFQVDYSGASQLISSSFKAKVSKLRAHKMVGRDNTTFELHLNFVFTILSSIIKPSDPATNLTGNIEDTGTH